MRWLVFLAVLATGGVARGDRDVYARDGETVVLDGGWWEDGYVYPGGTLILENGAWIDEGTSVIGGTMIINSGGTRSVSVSDGGTGYFYSPFWEWADVRGADSYVAVYGTRGIPEFLDVYVGATVDIFLDVDIALYHPTEDPLYLERIELELPATYTASTRLQYSPVGVQYPTDHLFLTVGSGGTVNIHPYAVPEPSSATLFLLGLLGLRRRHH